MGPNYKRIDVLKQTAVDWAPSYKAEKYLGKLVKCSLMTDMVVRREGAPTDLIWHRVCVWGADDFGMEKDFYQGEDSTPDPSRDKAMACFLSVISLERVNPSDLQALGFENA
jgi:hypothetical protein